MQAEQWIKTAHGWTPFAAAKLLGSYALGLGIKLAGCALAAAVLLDMMYSLRTITEQRRR